MGEILLLALSGLVSGFAAGLGMGGGTILIPILTLWLGVPQLSAQGVNLLSFLPAACIASFLHFKKKSARARPVVTLIVPGIIGAVIGALLSVVISDKALKPAFGVFLILFALYQGYLNEKKAKEEHGRAGPASNTRS